MGNKEIFDFKKLYHAYLLVGDRKYWQGILAQELKGNLKIENLSAYPDLFWQAYDSFGVKDSHTLIEKESRKSFSGTGRFFVLEINSATSEAQNALIKTFEESIPDTHFFIIARSAEIFLPTVCSRMMVLGTPKDSPLGAAQGESLGVGKFLKLDLPDRLEFLQKEFLKSKDKSKSEIIDFVIELEKTLRAGIEMRKITKDEELILYELEKSRRYLENPRSSNRLILEHLALILPN
ncbi:MAG: hypothetical protein WCV68_01330 [Candidatus Paceibacterota bacterium]